MPGLISGETSAADVGKLAGSGHAVDHGSLLWEAPRIPI